MLPMPHDDSHLRLASEHAFQHCMEFNRRIVPDPTVPGHGSSDDKVTAYLFWSSWQQSFYNDTWRVPALVQLRRWPSRDQVDVRHFIATLPAVSYRDQTIQQLHPTECLSPDELSAAELCVAGEPWPPNMTTEHNIPCGCMIEIRMKRPDAATATRTGADDGQPSNRRTVSAKTVKICHTPEIRTYQVGSRIASPSPAHPEILHTPPPPLYQIDIGEVREVLDQVVEPWPNNTVFDSLPPLDWNEATVDILSTLDQALSSEPVKAALFYEPGVEYGLSPGSWAVLLVLETPPQPSTFGASYAAQ